ncbi:MAG: arginine--tRNA ligase [Kiritimatiellae bacterium]|nr:arginine--tRNA ligase [Kiritimatiellia bacterium]
MNDRMTLEQELADWLSAAFERVAPGAGAVGVTPAGLAAHGDYQCNAAMSAARVVRRSPRALAEEVCGAAGRHPAVASIEVAGPGFINLRLDTEWLARRMDALAEDPRLGVPEPGAGRTLIIDYSSPNVAKPMHIGHIRSTVIGNALDRLHRALGYRVITDNHLGDWGTQFGILIQGFRAFADPAAYEASPIEELERVYVASYQRAKEDPAWMDASRQELVRLQAGDPGNRDLWQSFVDHSRREFDRIYERLDVRFDLVRGESWYHDRLAGVVGRLRELGLVQESDGALCVFSDGTRPPKEDPFLIHEDGEWRPHPCIVRKSDGGYNYATTDLATVLSREEEFHPDAVIYVTDERQQLHFRQFFDIARRMGARANLVHVWFGLMRLPEGTFSTRQGNVIKLEKLLDEAETRALALVRASSPGMSEAQQREVARAVGIGAVKYADLSQHPQSLVTFSWDKALALEGNSAPYLQYAHARIRSVRDRYAAEYPDRPADAAPVRLEEPVERDLALRLVRFGDAVARAAAQYKPSILADYLFDLAQHYSSFYQNVPFLKAPDGVRESRVKLCGLVAEALRTGLGLLGIESPERI